MRLEERACEGGAKEKREVDEESGNVDEGCLVGADEDEAVADGVVSLVRWIATGFTEDLHQGAL